MIWASFYYCINLTGCTYRATGEDGALKIIIKTVDSNWSNP